MTNIIRDKASVLGCDVQATDMSLVDLDHNRMQLDGTITGIGKKRLVVHVAVPEDPAGLEHHLMPWV